LTRERHNVPAARRRQFRGTAAEEARGTGDAEADVAQVGQPPGGGGPCVVLLFLSKLTRAKGAETVAA
jgi:hypothetical protein